MDSSICSKLEGECAIAVAGAGIGGLAFALALQRSGLDAAICERAPVLKEIGAGLLLTPNATGILRTLGLLEDARRDGMVVSAWRILDRAGRTLQEFRAGTPELPCVSIARPALQSLLLRQIGASRVRLGCEVIGAEPLADRQGCRLRFADGGTLSAKLAVGADGARSAVRRALFPERRLRYSGYVGWRALADWTPSPWDEGLVSEAWADGSRFGISPVGNGRTYWYATENVPPGCTVPVGERKRRLLAKFRRWHAPIPELIESTPDEAILLNDIHDFSPLPSWRGGRAVLLGDAAHLMTPNLGQGAAMAMEDALTLAACLAESGINEAALRRYERRRKVRVHFVAHLSRHLGRVIQLEHPILWRARNLALRATPDLFGEAALRPVFSFRD